MDRRREFCDCVENREHRDHCKECCEKLDRHHPHRHEHNHNHGPRHEPKHEPKPVKGRIDYTQPQKDLAVMDQMGHDQNNLKPEIQKGPSR